MDESSLLLDGIASKRWSFISFLKFVFRIRYFSMKSGKALAVLDHHFDTISDVKSCLEYSLAASSDGTISVWTLYV